MVAAAWLREARKRKDETGTYRTPEKKSGLAAKDASIFTEQLDPARMRQKLRPTVRFSSGPFLKPGQYFGSKEATYERQLVACDFIQCRKGAMATFFLATQTGVRLLDLMKPKAITEDGDAITNVYKNALFEEVERTDFPRDFHCIAGATFRQRRGIVFIGLECSELVVWDSIIGLKTVSRIQGLPAKVRFVGVSSPPRGNDADKDNIVALAAEGGSIYLVDTSCMTVIAALRMNGDFAVMSFHPKRPLLYSCDKKGNIYHWDINQGKLVHRAKDYSILNYASIAASEGTLALGCTSGYVSLHKTNTGTGYVTGSDAARKEFKHLTFRTDSLAYIADGKHLLMASSEEVNHVRAVNVQGKFVYCDFPVRSKPFHRIKAIKPDGKYAAIVQDDGVIFLLSVKN